MVIKCFVEVNYVPNSRMYFDMEVEESTWNTMSILQKSYLIEEYASKHHTHIGWRESKHEN